MANVTSIPYGDKSVAKSKVDPPKYNRGQVIHQKPTSNLSNIDTASVVASAKLYKQNVVLSCICVDWFQACIDVLNIDVLSSLTQRKVVEEIQVNDDVLLSYSGNGTKNFEKLYKVYLYGIHYATLQFDTRCPQLFDYNSGIIKLENQVLYTSSWLDDFKYIISEMGARVRSITRLDIAIDGSDKAIEFINRWVKGRTLGRKGKAAITPCYRNDLSIESVIVGRPSSDKQISIYEKLQEISKSNKSYITEFWKNNGLQIGDKVWRTEIRMNSGITSSYDWQRLDDPAYLASIARTELKNYLEFYYKGKDSNKHRTYKNKSMEIIDFDRIGGKLLEKRENKPPSDVYRAKQAIKHLYREDYLNGIEDAVKVANDLTVEYGLSDWLNMKLPYWIDEWCKEKKVRQFTSDIRECSN